jgi:hypothetical protein
MEEINMLDTFNVKSATTYVITYVVESEKCFYADNVENNLETETFLFLDVSIKDLDKIKIGNRFINRTGHMNKDGCRTRVSACIEFIEEK